MAYYICATFGIIFVPAATAIFTCETHSLFSSFRIFITSRNIHFRTFSNLRQSLKQTEILRMVKAVERSTYNVRSGSRLQRHVMSCDIIFERWQFSNIIHRLSLSHHNKSSHSLNSVYIAKRTNTLTVFFRLLLYILNVTQTKLYAVYQQTMLLFIHFWCEISWIQFTDSSQS